MTADAGPVSCPAPLHHDTIQLSHGGGGRRTRELVEAIFYAAFGKPRLEQRHDSAVVRGAARLALTTDSYVVSPLFFPGGDIGKLAVFGTVNDLAMAGASPRYLTAGFVLEEGLPLEQLRRVASSMAKAAERCSVQIVCGDTKVVDRGRCDGLYVNTAGVGLLSDGVSVSPARIEPGDVVVLNGDLGRHGIAVLSVREGLEFQGAPPSDCAPLHDAAKLLMHGGLDVHCLRDLTRGGLATALNELALDTGLGIDVDETRIFVHEGVKGACELMGLDPLYVANEGRMIAILPESEAERVLSLWPRDPAQGLTPVVIGRVLERAPGARAQVTARGRLGQTRLLDLLSGEQLPRIC